MRKLPCWLSFVTLLTLIPGVGWAEPQVSLTSERERYFVGENVLLQFTVKNTGKQPLKIDVGGDYRGAPRSLRFKVEASDAQGRALPDPHPNPACFGGLGCQPSLKSGESFSASLALAHYRRIPGKGRYRISASHDLGWKQPGQAWLELEFVEPSPSQARQLVHTMARLPERVSISMGQPTPPFKDFWTLSYPVYLPALAELAATPGGVQALSGMGQIATPAATQQLLRLAQRPDLRLPAAHQLCLRLPTRAPDAQFGVQERKRLAQGSWNQKLRERARELGGRLLAGSDEEVSCAATLLAELGDGRDVPALLHRLDHYLVPVSTYPRPAGPCNDLERALAAQLARTPFPVTPIPPAPSALLIQLSRPQPSSDLIEAGLQCRTARVREQAVLAIKESTPYRDKLRALVRDLDPGVQVAACEKLAGDDAVLDLVGRTTDEWVLRAAAQACQTRRWECAQILLPRLSDPTRWRIIYVQLLDLVLTRVPGYSSNGEPDAAELTRLCGAWRDFLVQHRAELQAGTTYKTLPPALIPNNFQLSPQ